MDLEIIILSEASQTETDSKWYHLFVESKKMIQMNWFTKQKQTDRLRKLNCCLAAGNVRGKVN